MTPEPLGPFVLRLVPIRACHPKPIDGWLIPSGPSLVVPTLCVYMEDCPPLSTESLVSTTALLSHLPANQDAQDLLSEGHVTC